MNLNENNTHDYELYEQYNYPVDQWAVDKDNEHDYGPSMSESDGTRSTDELTVYRVGLSYHFLMNPFPCGGV